MQTLVELIKKAITEDFNAVENVSEDGSIKLHDSYDSEGINDAVQQINTDINFDYFAYYDPAYDNVIRYEYYENKARDLMRSDVFKQELYKLIERIEELEDANKLAYITYYNDSYHISSTDDSYSLSIDLY
ncbi:hypothetical protein [Macrococcoides canis]|uniref:hypothetical protein n=1 Tax=Macrococcoides canis TaxID=1855823 RepID=UPI00165D3B37|nr:hypothetical protein [Macrococcus canis]QNR09125.1 hypothetical protein GL258_12630 [Macrococcus canis]